MDVNWHLIYVIIMRIFEGFLTLYVDLFYIVLAKLLSPAIVNTGLQSIAALQKLLLFSSCYVVAAAYQASSSQCSLLPISPRSASAFWGCYSLFSLGAQLDNSSAQSG